MWIFLFGAGVAYGESEGSIVGWGLHVILESSKLDDLVAVDGATYHSIGLRSDGTIVCWGWNASSQCEIPEPNEDFLAVAAGGMHSLGLKSDGTIVAWGSNSYGQCDVPDPNEDFIKVAAGTYHSLGLKSNGTIVAWGLNDDDQCDTPEPNEAFVGIACGHSHSLGLKIDGTIAAWGNNINEQCDISLPNEDFVAIAGGTAHSLGIKSEGAVIVWGSNDYGQCIVPEPNEGFVAVAGGFGHSLGLKISTVTASQYPGTGDTPGAAIIDVHSLSPNPFNPSTQISFETRVPGHVTMEIFDVRGRRVTMFSLGVLESGLHQTWWDGRNARGDNVPSGIYFVRLSGSAGESQAVKAVLLR